ncbi:MAG: ribosome hibernation-promoting factor, HPF/YfiA family [Nitrospinales bacterium]
MNLTITGKNIEVTEGIKTHLTHKMGKTIDGLEEHADVHVILAAEKHRHSAEIIVTTKGLSLNSKDETDDLYVAMDHALEKMEKQLRKHKDRVRSLKRKGHKAEKKKLDRL